MRNNGLFSVVKLAICITVSALFSAVTVYVVDALVTHWYMYSKGVTSLSDLSNDYGFAMLLLFWYILSSVVSFCLSCRYSMRYVDKLFKKDEK